jgi:hypothetical protein
VLLERDRELAALDALIGEAAAGQARLALIEGPATKCQPRLLPTAALSRSSSPRPRPSRLSPELRPELRPSAFSNADQDRAPG